MTLSDTESVLLRRPMTPVKSKLTLERGRNSVAWMGPDGWTIERVARGIGGALVKAEWDQHHYRPAGPAGPDPMLTIQRGVAFRIEVRRPVSWPQPAGVSPRSVFAGEVPKTLKIVVQRDSADVMNH